MDRERIEDFIVENAAVDSCREFVGPGDRVRRETGIFQGFLLPLSLPPTPLNKDIPQRRCPVGSVAPGPPVYVAGERACPAAQLNQVEPRGPVERLPHLHEQLPKQRAEYRV